MKRFIILIFPLILLADNYEFGPSIIVNDDTPGSHWQSTTQRSVACRGDTVFLVWRDDRYGNPLWYNSRIFFSKSTDAGNTWNPNLMIGNGSDTLWNFGPHLVLDSFGNIYIGYPVQNQNNNNSDVYFTKSTDGGITFATPIIVNDSSDIIYQAGGAIAVDSIGQNVYVVWEDRRNLSYYTDIYLARSTDGGTSFLPALRVNDDFDSTKQSDPVVACDNSGQRVCVTWQDKRDTLHNWDIYFSRSTDYGQTFETNYPINDTALTGDTIQKEPSIWYINGIIYVCWADQGEEHPIYSAKSVDNGVSFGASVQVRDSTVNGSGIDPSITADDSENVYIVWRDSRNFSSTGYDIYFSYSDDGGMTFSSDVRVNDLLGIYSAWDKRPAVAVNEEGTVFVAWSSDRYGILNYDVYSAAGELTGINEFFYSNVYTSGIKVFPTIFKNSVSIKLQNLGLDGRVSEIQIYNATGQLVKQFNYSTNQPFNYILWDGRDKLGFEIPGGTYFIVFELDKKLIQTKKIIKIK